MAARPKSRGATVAAALMAAAAVGTAITGLPPLGLTEPPIRHVLAVLLALNMLYVAWGTYRLDGAAWLCGVILYGGGGAFVVAALIVGPRPLVAWADAIACAVILGCLALPSVRAAFRRARAIKGVVRPPP